MKKKNELKSYAHGYPDEVRRSIQMNEAQERTGATAYELEYFFATGKKLKKIKKEESRD